MPKTATETVELHRIPEATDLPLILYRAAIAEQRQGRGQDLRAALRPQLLARRLAQRHLSLPSLPRDRP